MGRRASVHHHAADRGYSSPPPPLPNSQSPPPPQRDRAIREAEANFVLLTEAYTTLSCTVERGRYDRQIFGGVGSGLDVGSSPFSPSSSASSSSRYQRQRYTPGGDWRAHAAAAAEATLHRRRDRREHGREARRVAKERGEDNDFQDAIETIFSDISPFSGGGAEDSYLAAVQQEFFAALHVAHEGPGFRTQGRERGGGGGGGGVEVEVDAMYGGGDFGGIGDVAGGGGGVKASSAVPTLPSVGSGGGSGSGGSGGIGGSGALESETESRRRREARLRRHAWPAAFELEIRRWECG